MSKELLIFVGIVFVVLLVSVIIMNNVTDKRENLPKPTVEERKEIAYSLGKKVCRLLFWIILGLPSIILISILKAVKMQKK